MTRRCSGHTIVSVLMLVTPTDREILTMFPGFRLMAMSMEDLEMLMAPRPFPGLVFPHPRLTDMEAQKVQSGLIAFQDVADASVGRIQRQSHVCQPCHPHILVVLEDRRLFMPHQAIIRVCDDAGLGIDLGDRLVYPMQGDQRQQR
jgi:hypothetical protein